MQKTLQRLQKSQSRIEALILIKCSFYLLPVIQSCDVKCPEADTRLPLKNFIHVAENASKRLWIQKSVTKPFKFFFHNSLRPVDIIIPQVKRNWVKDSDNGHRQCTSQIIPIWISLSNKCTFFIWERELMTETLHCNQNFLVVKVYSYVSLQIYN